MESKERGFIAVVLTVIVVMVTADLITDAREGVRLWHLLVEATIAFAALMGILLLLRGTFGLKRSLVEERALSSRLQVEAESWRSQSKKYVEGLSQTIDFQLTNWKLTQSEKEIAFLLLKGLSLKEIAEIRKTTEKTARTQSVSIYSKAGLAGRSELAAFFLEDLLPPPQKPHISI
jgi:DNA-binding CsgD family transcriptional regulator